MIAKVITNSSIVSLMNYLCGQEHQVLSCKGVLPVNIIENVTSTFRRNQNLNNRIRKPNFHIVLAFAPEDVIDDEKLENIVEDFLNVFEKDNECWVAIKHKDSLDGHQHLHICLNRVLKNGLVLSDSHSLRRAMKIARTLEKKYGLQSLEGLNKASKNGLFEILRTTVDNGLNNCKTLSCLSNYIELKTGFHIKINRGISFINNSNGIHIKGSSLGRGYSRLQLENRLKHINLKDEKSKRSESVVKNTKLNSLPLELLDELLRNTGGLSNPDQDEIEFPKKKKKQRRKF